MSTANQIPVTEYLKNHDLQKLIEDAINECYKSNASDPKSFLANFFSKSSNDTNISKLVGREVLDSRGNPTVEVDVYCGGKLVARASAPSGASTGSNEARELRDNDSKRYLGKGTTTAVANVSDTLSNALNGTSVTDLVECDNVMQKADGTELKENIGGNAITATSFAIANAGAKLNGQELFLYLNKQYNTLIKSGNDDPNAQKYSLPTPLVNILNGGKHAGGKLKIQEFMIVPKENITFKEKLRQVAEVYHHLGKLVVKEKGKSAKNVGDEGGFAPNLETADEALNVIEKAIEAAGYKVGEDIRLALDCAASEFYDQEKKQYEISEGVYLTSEGMVDFYDKLITDHPALISIEDGLDEKDYEGWKKLTEKIGDKVMIIGDDLYTTNTNLIKKGIEEKWANALLLKVNQIGTISESMNAAHMISSANQNVIVSHRSGETETTLISDLAVAISARYIKTGATARGERIAKYNRLLQIEEYLVENNLLKE